MDSQYKYPEELYEEVIRLREQAISEGKGWSDIYDRFPDIPKSTLKDIFYRWRDRIQPPVPQVKSALSEGDIVNEEEVWRLALQKSKKRREIEESKNGQEIIFEHGPVCLVWLADLHLGDTGVDYDRLDQDLDLILDTPGMYACLVGDITNNFIVGRLKDLRLGAEFSISEEWVLAKRVLKKIAPRLLLSVAGNHDLWTYALTSVDYLAEIHDRINPDVLYSKYDAGVKIVVGQAKYMARVRHTWRGYSQYNPTHGIEWAAKFDQARPFDIGIAAHTHASGLYRQFNNGGKTGHALLCGSYKVYDDYAEKMAYPRANDSAAVALMFYGDTISGTNNIRAAATFMETAYS